MIEPGEYTIEFLNDKRIAHVWIERVIYTPDGIPILLCTNLGKMYNWYTITSIYQTETVPTGITPAEFRKSANPYDR
jgi:hypothetical protein